MSHHPLYSDLSPLLLSGYGTRIVGLRCTSRGTGLAIRTTRSPTYQYPDLNSLKRVKSMLMSSAMNSLIRVYLEGEIFGHANLGWGNAIARPLPV